MDYIAKKIGEIENQYAFYVPVEKELMDGKVVLVKECVQVCFKKELEAKKEQLEQELEDVNKKLSTINEEPAIIKEVTK